MRDGERHDRALPAIDTSLACPLNTRPALGACAAPSDDGRASFTYEGMRVTT